MRVHHDVAVQALWRVEKLRLVEEKQGRLSSSTGAAVAAVGVVAISRADPVTRARLHAGRAKPSSCGQQ